MCIIIDANKMGSFLTDPPDDTTAPIHDWLETKGGKIVYSTGGKFAAEIGRRARDRLGIYARSGKAILVDAGRLQADESRLAPRIESNDPHMLALALASQARLLYTDDADLIKDFKNKRFIDNPRGKVYRRGRQAKTLLTKSSCA